jgi:energy-coupling factor transport system permease protein
MIKESLKMRNIRFSFFQPLQYLEFLLVPVLIRATMIAEEMTANAITKGVESPVKRSSYYKTNMSLLDYIILFSVTIFFLSILI